jgi:hypothetical protein
LIKILYSLVCNETPLAIACSNVLADGGRYAKDAQQIAAVHTMLDRLAQPRKN